MTRATDPVELTRRLVRCPSVTPEEGGALALLDGLLSEAGFETRRIDRGGVPNLFARFGPAGHPRSFGFNGHTDVVPPGDRALWSVDPFGGEIRDGCLWGRGAVDMKSGVAAFVCAAIDRAAEGLADGAIVLTITGDEEGEARHGTRAILSWMEAAGERMSACVVGEPTSRETLGDQIKIGRRGSLTAWFTARGVQGHAAYPQRARNPVSALARLLTVLTEAPLDSGSPHFEPTVAVPTTFDVGNPATNVIPAEARTTVNIRFNDRHSGESLTRRLRELAARISADSGVEIAVEVRVSGEPFLTPPGPLVDLAVRAVEAETGRRPALSTSGGTSDARFIKDHCPVVEVGLTGRTMHAVDERVPLAEITALARIYRRMLDDWFA